MKSLEHLIRDIREGKCECEKKKDSLEGAIRKVRRESSFATKDSKPVEEDVAGMAGSGEGKTYGESVKKKKQGDEEDIKLPGNEDKMDEAIGTLGTDKYQGTEFKSIRTSTPHITPPGPEHGHSQAPENASRLRSVAKEKAGINRVSEGVYDFAAKTAFNFAKPYVASTGRALVKYGEKAVEKLAGVTKAAEELPKPAEKLGLPAPKAEPKLPATTAKVEPKLAAPAAAEVAPKTATQPKVETKPEVKTDTKVKVPAPEVKVEPKVPAEVKPATVPATKTAPAPKVAPATPKAPPPVKKGVGPGIPKGLLSLGGIPAPSLDQPGKPHIQAPTKVHGTKAHRLFKESSGTDVRKKIYDMPIGGERKETSYVGRPNDDVKGTSEKLSRQSQYKIKIIDESKKLASIVKNTVKEKKEILDKPTRVYDNGQGDLIVINPDAKKNSLDVKNQ